MTVTKSQVLGRQSLDFSILGQDLTRLQDVSNLATIGTRIHKDSTTNAPWNATSKLKTRQTMTKRNASCFNQVGPCFSFDGIAINGNVIELVTQDDKSTNPTITNDDIAGIAKNHPRDIFLIGKFNKARQLKTISWKDQIIGLSTYFCITIAMQGFLKTDINSF
ncbi:Uncharacterised protein [Streptococcus pneumoniae]|nr:Uncharacterised protein [Streptococcus pneumoniae]CAG6324198.1 Uncharacterised protein [Streptococcus pneumoniae]